VGTPTKGKEWQFDFDHFNLYLYTTDDEKPKQMPADNRHFPQNVCVCVE
jgi:hypothetical protein